ncbi:MAG: beta-ketoacyl synthase N-terminal-like domain-containing protein, partial [Bdellovibrionota bacterium]
MNDLRAQSQFPIVEEIWKEILRRTEIDRDRTFMDLGGTSLSGAQLVARVSKRLGISIPVTKLFEHPTLRQFVNFIDGGENLVSPTSPEPIAPKSNSDRDIAIVGMACRFPGARNLSEFWNNLLAGKDSIEDLTKEELSPEISEELKNDPRYVRARGRIADPFKLDAAFFDINPMEAKLIDPQQRVMLETAWEALEHAGHGPGSFSGRAAVFAGIEDNSYYKSEILPFPEAEKRAGRLSIMTGNEKDFVAMRIAHKLNLKGPAVSVHTACSTSLVAVVMACQSLRQGESDLAVAGGASIHF